MKWWLMTLCLSISATAYSLTSADISQYTLQAVDNCLHYRVLGVCYWQYFGITSTTPYIEHYLPDVVVSVFDSPDKQAWLELRDSIDVAGQAAEKTITQTFSGDHVGYGRHSAAQPQEQQVFFKEVDVIGDPALLMLDHSYLLPSTAAPLMPYYQSMLDTALWRGLPPVAMPEQLVALAQDLTSRIGQFPIVWGGAFPIEGKINASDEAKASAVIAQRGVNVLSMIVPLHVYQALSNDCGQGCEASDFHENDENTEFQRVYPEPETTCSVFGKTLRYGDGDLIKAANGSYVWVVWRHYHGCIQGVGKYIGHT